MPYRWKEGRSPLTKEAVEYVEFFIENEADITWVLRQQEKLRLEYIMFLKKDLPEIIHQQKIRKWPWNRRQYEDSVRALIEDYSRKIETSIDMLSADFVQKMRNADV